MSVVELRYMSEWQRRWDCAAQPYGLSLGQCRSALLVAHLEQPSYAAPSTGASQLI